MSNASACVECLCLMRMALQPGDVLRLVLGQGAGMALLGVGVGLGATLGVTRLMAKMLFSVSATDPLTLGGVSVILTAVALVACYITARRAMRTDHVIALR